ncbi:ABC transporter substrate-binding protein [Arthrobacter sp. CDRTa11]|uniref:ABC transporter substrate-binding protein n=1 Tax=Arthrobacter sp. CDRTa11 TaxID=2651199 RepID=UPI00226597A9|nr:ABC transporter substrate-binding protein [Arthrobacter sp. CDRTa11]UZX03111.1 ABC transporter substrate-binding protein [Arthrobacter sp. CDRTa11]
MFIQRRLKSISIVALALTATLTTVAGCSPGPGSTNGTDGSGETVDIVAGVAASMSSLNLRLGMEQGFFAEEGLNVTTVPSGTGAGGVTGLINGEIQVALGGLSGTITAASQNIPVVFVSGGIADAESPEGPWYATLVSPDSGIKSFKDLEGKTVAINSLNCCWDFWTRESVIADGGDDSKLKLVQLPFAQQATALASGQVDAITTQQPFAKQAELEGFVSIGDPAAIAYGDPENGNTNYFMAKSFVDDNPGVVERWRAALQKSTDYAKANPDKVREAAISMVSLNPDLVKAAPVPNFVVELDRNAIEKETGWLLKYGVIQNAPSVDSLIVP